MDTRGVSLYINSRQRSEEKDMWESMLVFSVLLPKCSRKFMSQTGKVIRQSIEMNCWQFSRSNHLIDLCASNPKRLCNLRYAQEEPLWSTFLRTFHWFLPFLAGMMVHAQSVFGFDREV